MSDRPAPIHSTGAEPGLAVGGVSHVVATGAVGPLDADGALLHEGDLTAQIALSITNLDALLRLLDMDLTDVVRLGISTTDPAALDARLYVVTERFDELGHRPLLHVRAVVDLPLPGMSVAVDAVAAR